MKHTITLMIAMLPLTAVAGGLAPPLDESPRLEPRPVAASNWAGAYGGLAAGRQRREQTRTTLMDVTGRCKPLAETGHYSNKCVAEPQYTVDLRRMGWRACDDSDNPQCVIGSHGDNDLIWLNEPFTYVTDTFTDIQNFTSDGGSAGAFGGVRYEVGAGFLIGGEVTAMRADGGDLAMAELTASYDLGTLLPHIDAGFATDGALSGPVVSVGVDMALGGNWFAGVEGYKADLDGSDVTGGHLRVGFRF